MAAPLIILSRHSQLHQFAEIFNQQVEPLTLEHPIRNILINDQRIGLTVIDELNPSSKSIIVEEFMSNHRDNCSSALILDMFMPLDMYSQSTTVVHDAETMMRCLNIPYENLNERQRLKLRVLCFAKPRPFPLEFLNIPISHNGPLEIPRLEFLQEFPPHIANAVIEHHELQFHEPIREPQHNTNNNNNPDFYKRLKLDCNDSDSNTEDASNIEDACCICMDRAKTIMFVPCQHQVVCDGCAATLMEMQESQRICPICRESIQDLFRPRII